MIKISNLHFNCFAPAVQKKMSINFRFWADFREWAFYYDVRRLNGLGCFKLKDNERSVCRTRYDPGAFCVSILDSLAIFAGFEGQGFSELNGNTAPIAIYFINPAHTS